MIFVRLSPAWKRSVYYIVCVIFTHARAHTHTANVCFRSSHSRRVYSCKKAERGKRISTLGWSWILRSIIWQRLCCSVFIIAFRYLNLHLLTAWIRMNPVLSGSAWLSTAGHPVSSRAAPSSCVFHLVYFPPTLTSEVQPSGVIPGDLSIPFDSLPSSLPPKHSLCILSSCLLGFHCFATFLPFLLPESALSSASISCSRFYLAHVQLQRPKYLTALAFSIARPYLINSVDLKSNSSLNRDYTCLSACCWF